MSPADRARAASAVRASVERDTEAADLGYMKSAAPEQPRRQSPTERLHEVTMAAMTRPTAAPEHSCDLTRNAKGQTQIALTVRGADLGEVVALAVASYDSLRARYPLPSGYVGAEGEPQTGGAK